MTNQHPITPPPELVQEWTIAALGAEDWLGGYNLELIAIQAARWGADQELEACCALMDEWGLDETDLRFARRLKSPSLKEQALAKLPEHPENMASYLSLSPGSVATIRRALEALDD